MVVDPGSATGDIVGSDERRLSVPAVAGAVPTTGVKARVPERWVRPVGWAALAVWLAIPVLGVTAQPLAGRVVWTVAVAGLPLFIVLVGYHRWRRICPLAFFSQIPVRLRRSGTRRASARFEQHYYFVPFLMFFSGLWLRLIWTNGDGVAIAVFFILLSLGALSIGALFTGKTWCNYICPVSFIEKIYTEPRGLRETQNSQCAKCTACKKACPDINEENGYWKEIESAAKRFVYFAYPGLVFGFYFYYFLQAGTWDYYFDGTWTDEPGMMSRAFQLGSDSRTAGFFFLPALPRALAAALTLALCAAVSFAIFWVAEGPVGRWLRQRNANADANHVRNVMFGIAAFAAFVIFYSFAGQPTLRKIPWLPAYASVLVVLTAALFLLRRLTRTHEAFAEQSLARNIIKRWTWADTPPPANLHDAYVVYTVRTTERERMYAEVMESYQDAVREVLADGVVTREEVQRLQSLRDQLHIKKADHDRVMANLAEEERALLTDPTKQASAEKRLQLETYGRALAHDLERVLATQGGANDNFVQQLRVEFGVSREEHAAVLDTLLGSDKTTAARAVGAVKLIQHCTHRIQVLGAQASPTYDALSDCLRLERTRAVDRLLRALSVAPDDATLESLRGRLGLDDPAVAAAVVEQVGSQLRPSIRDRLSGGLAEAARESATVLTPADALNACLTDADPFVRALGLYGLAERGPVEAEILNRLADDENTLVQETARAVHERRETTTSSAVGRAPMLMIEKIIALRCVSVFAALGPEDLEELARSSDERTYQPGEALCIEGQLGDEVYVLLAGEAHIVHGPAADGDLIRIETVGSVIGEMAVLEAAPRSASVFASVSGARALRLAGNAFRRVLEMNPAVAAGIIRTLAHRLRRVEEVPSTS
jgi:hypothetical protein